MDTISKYFPSLSDLQSERFIKLSDLFKHWNERINIISRKDIENLETHHILHSLALAKFINFSPKSNILDLGSGGGLPGLPLAIFFPEVNFHLIDRIGKKMMVADNIAKELGLDNVTVQHGDVGECKGKFDFIVNRGVMPQMDIIKSTRKLISPNQRNALPNGIISLKGGNLQGELKGLENITEVIDIKNYFKEPFFEEKKIVYSQVI